MAELLMVGTIPNANPPVTANAKLYAYGTTYGVGVQPLGLLVTTDVAPAGGGGKTVFRGLNVPVQWQAGATVQVTPLVDENNAQPSLQRSYASQPTITTEFFSVPMAVDGTTVAAEVQVVAAAGPVRLGLNATGRHLPRTGAFPGVVPGP